jgi:hypothetical protein
MNGLVCPLFVVFRLAKLVRLIPETGVIRMVLLLSLQLCKCPCVTGAIRQNSSSIVETVACVCVAHLNSGAWLCMQGYYTLLSKGSQDLQDYPCITGRYLRWYSNCARALAQALIRRAFGVATPRRVALFPNLIDPTFQPTRKASTRS